MKQKTAARQVVIDEQLKEAIAKLKSEEGKSMTDKCFVDADVINPSDSLRKKIERYFKPTKWHVQSHDFRKTWATDTYKRTKDIALVKSGMGHACIKNTQKYIEADHIQNASDILLKLRVN